MKYLRSSIFLKKQYQYNEAVKLAIKNYGIMRSAENVPLEKIRNIGISAHIDSGKTTLTERILYYTGRIKEMHEVKGKDGVGAVMDSMELERQRGITIQSAATYTMWNDHNINIIDTPGHVDFTIEVERALRVLDGAILVVCSVGGVQSQTITVNRQMKRYDVPFITFINKLDRMRAYPLKVAESLRKKLGHNSGLMQLPIGKESNFKGVIDLLNEKAIYFTGDSGTDVVYEDIPAEMRAEAKDRWQETVECLANADETIGEMFLVDEVPSVDDIKKAIRRTCIKRTFNPVYFGTALKNKGVQPLLDAVIDYLPCPSDVVNYILKTYEDKETKVPLNSERSKTNPTVGLAFKMEENKDGTLTYIRMYQGKLSRGDALYNSNTNKKIKFPTLHQMHSNKMEDINAAYAGDIIAVNGLTCNTGDTYVREYKSGLSMESMFVPDPVISMSIKPKQKLNSDKFSKALNHFCRSDPTFRLTYNEEMEELIASGMGELHLEVYSQRLEREYGIAVELGKPKVAFRETIVSPIQFDYLHKKQTGGSGQYGRVIGILEPLPPEKQTEIMFESRIEGTCIPRQFLKSIEKGFINTCEQGFVYGQKIAGVKFILLDGAAHIVDSNDRAFQRAAEGAIKQCAETGIWKVLEPVMKVEVNVPNEFSSTVITGLSVRKGIITSTELGIEWTSILCETPLNNMFGYSREIRSLTQGKGEFTMEYVRYTVAENSLQQKLLEEFEEINNKVLGKGKAKKR